MTSAIHIDIDACRSCGSADLQEVLHFGTTPLADGLVTEAQLDQTDPTAPLTLLFCRSCSLAQIRETVDPEVLFFSEYPYFSSVSPSLMAHFAASAESIIERFDLSPSTVVVEAASNDGYMLRNFAESGIPVQGIDPAPGPAAKAIELGIPTIVDFLGIDMARRLRDEEGLEAEVFLANNVLAHVPDLNGFVAGVEVLLSETGTLVAEAPYVVDLVDHGEFDTIYHQHLCYFSLTAVDALFARHGLRLVDVEQVAIHGGTVRMFVRRSGDRSAGLEELLATEAARGVTDGSLYSQFAARVEAIRSGLRAILDDARAADRRVVGYGAAAKATTLMAYCGIDLDDLEYVVDLNPYKHGRYMSGTRIPIYSPERIHEDQPPDDVVILAWNFAEEIMRQQAAHLERGGRFVIPIPEPRVVSTP